MPARASATLLQAFFELRRINDILHKDTEIALTHLQNVALAFNTGPSQALADEANFWCKTAIRSFMGEVDSLGYVMRKMVLQNAEKMRLSLTMKTRARLMERRYEAATDSIAEDKPSPLSPEQGLKDAFKYFPRLFGADYRLDTGGEPWRGFKTLVRVRNNITHPKIPEHLGTVNALPALHPTLVWFYGQVYDLFMDIAKHAGTAVPAKEPFKSAWPPFSESGMPWRNFFSEADHKLIMESGSRTLQYVELLFQLLHKDISRAMDLCNGSFESLNTLRGPAAQFAFRTLLRNLSTNVEGHTSAARFFLEASKARGETRLTREEEEALSTGEVEDRLASAIDLWAREFGDDRVARREGASWQALKAMRELRNRILHPRKLQDLEITLTHTTTILAAHGYLTDGMGAFMINIDKWERKAGRIKDAVEQERTGSSPDEETDTEDD